MFIPATGQDHQYLKAFDVFVMSSIKEGFPYVLLEAMSAGVPVVVTAVGGVPEMLEGHQNGLLVAHQNPDVLAHSIKGLLAHRTLTKELARKEQTSVTEKFSLEKMVNKTEEVYRRLLTPEPKS